MNAYEWKIFYGRLRFQGRRDSSIATFSMDFSASWRAAIPDETRRFHLWSTGFETRLWYLAITLYGTPARIKLRDSYYPLTTGWCRRRLGLSYRRHRKEKGYANVHGS